MGEIREPKPVVLFAAVSGKDLFALERAHRWLQQKWGNTWRVGEPFEFGWTQFYRKQMGDKILKQYLAFENLVDPAVLAESKLHSNQLEQDFAEEFGTKQVPRPLNIDPGYITEAKLVLATTKDRDHRIYLEQGILAEVTLFYQGDRWNASRWTYPDYQQARCLDFLDQCRTYLRKQIHTT